MATSATVTVASKLPMALVLHLEELREHMESTPMGVVKVSHYQKTGKTYTVKGVARHVGEPADPLSSGFALTHGVDKDFWDKWLETHRDYAPVVNGSLFAVDKKQSAQAEAKNRVTERSGFEPVDPDNLPREFTTGKAKITKATRD